MTTLAPANDRTRKPPAINFGTSRAEKAIAPYTFTLTGRTPDLAKMSWELNLVNGNEQFPERHAGVSFDNTVDGLTVSLCLAPAGVGTGSYAGTLAIAGPGVKPFQLPLSVNLKDNDLGLIWLGIVGATVLAIFFKWWSIKVADTANADNTPKIREFGKWIKRQWVTVLIAVAVAVGGVYYTKYFKRQSFVPGDRWALWASVFTAVASASLIVNAIGHQADKTIRNKTTPTH